MKKYLDHSSLPLLDVLEILLKFTLKAQLFEKEQKIAEATPPEYGTTFQPKYCPDKVSSVDHPRES